MVDFKVLVFSLEFPPYVGGAGTYAFELSNALVKLGYDVDVLTRKYDNLSDSYNTVDTNFKIYTHTWHKHLWFLHWPKYLDEHLSSHKYDLIICANWSSHVVACNSKLIYQSRYITVFHGDEMERYFGRRTIKFTLLVNRKRLMNFLLNSVKIIAVSNDMKKQLLENNFPVNKVNTVLHGINPDIFFPLDSSHFTNSLSLKKELLIQSSEKVLLCASRLEYGKGHDVLLKSCALLKKKGYLFKLLLAGSGSLESHLIEQTKLLGISDMVIFLGNVPRERLVSYHHISDFFVLISRRTGETFGLVYIEANACKKPVIAGRTGGVSESVEDGVSGYLVDPNSVEQVSSKIEYFFNNPEIVKKIGEQSYERFLKNFSCERMAIETINCI